MGDTTGKRTATYTYGPYGEQRITSGAQQPFAAVPRLQQVGPHLSGGGVRGRDHDIAQVAPHPSGPGRVPVTDEVEHRRASGDRAERPFVQAS
ncbi:hypothetical protein NHG22_10220 [Streptomyces sp. ATE26]|uniref:hypothetical protein n=1 Tax=unclassified Streptomyces TaxID=2593676 RepID=UPI00116B9F6B|nr:MULTISPECIES: hypothetical protein [unclassified Streptomyces]MDI1454188.1 hypothetical protein [Streptomyces sp. ATE26]GEK01550.1 hypothetical protein TNCT1_38260 [Streptomyces sp. 1-11]